MPARIARLVGALFAASLVAFLIMRAMPGDAASAVLFAQGIVPTGEAVAALEAAHGLDAPAWRQYAAWLGGLVTGDWGVSLRTGAPVLPTLVTRLPVSLAIGLGGLLAGTALALVLAFAAAAGMRFADVASRALAVLAQAFPAFCLGMLVIFVFGVRLHWIRPFTGGALERIVLPVAIVALYTCGSLARLVRRELLAAMASPFVRAARAKGASPRRALVVHAGPFGILALLAALRAEAAWVVGGTAVTEVLFDAPGVSAWVVESVAHRDYPVLQAYVMVVAIWMLAIHALLDVAVARIDPRRAP